MVNRKRTSTPEKSGSSEREGSPAQKRGGKSPARSRSGSRKLSGSFSGKKNDLRARYWSYLFDNLKRAVDEIYGTCEADESIVECQEVIMMLDQCRRDFSALIDRINVQDAFEKADYKDRPTSLAWEVRKLSSPGKTLFSSANVLQTSLDRNSTSPVRTLDFSPQPVPPLSQPLNHQSGNVAPMQSWADKVRGTTPSGTTAGATSKNTDLKEREHQNANPGLKHSSGNLEDCVVQDVNDDGDDEGWETVHRGRKSHSSHTKKGTKIGGEKPSNGKTESKTNNLRTQKTSNGLCNKGDGDVGNHHGDTEVCTEPKSNVGEASEKSMDVSNDKETPAISLDDEEEQDTLSDIEHEKALSAAMEEEESLSRQIEEWHDQAIASVIEHEKSLTKEIAEQEELVTAINGESEGNVSDIGQEEDMENMDGEEDNSLNCSGATNGESNSLVNSATNLTWEEMIAKYDADHSPDQESSWGDLVERAERPPGRAVHLHQRLSSPSRKRPLEEVVRIHEEKQLKAQQQRERMLEERLQSLQMLSEKVEKARELKDELIQQRQQHLDEKQRRAEQQRLSVLQEKVRKAQEEEAKVNEIAFINTLEAQNKKIEVLTRHQGHEARLQDIQEERQRKKEEQQAKEAAAQERRRQLEAERLARLEEMQLKKLEQEAKYKREKHEKEKAREEAAKEKAREREMRIAARNEALQTATEQLQLKIQQKQAETTRRHEQVLEQVKEKAAGVSRHSTQDEVPAVTPYDRKKMCTLCNVEIVSEVYLLSHLRGKKHQQALSEIPAAKGTPEDKDTISLQYIKEMPSDKAGETEKADQERQKALRKRAKKLRTRMAAKGREYESNLTNLSSQRQESAKKPKLQKIVKDINRQLQSQGSGPWPANRVSLVERSLGELSRILESKVTADQVTFCNLGGLTALTRVLLVPDIASDKPPVKPIIPNKALCSVANVLTLACGDCLDNCRYMVCTNKLSSVVDLLAYQMKGVPSSQGSAKKGAEKEPGSSAINQSLPDPLATALLKVLATVLQCFATASPEEKELATLVQRMVDLIGYVVCSGVVDGIRSFFSRIHGPLDDDPPAVNYAQACLALLSATAQYLGSRLSNIFETRKEDLTQFVVTFQQTELVEIVSFLYAILMNVGNAQSLSPTLPDSTINVVTEALCMLNFMATVDLKVLQASLGAEGVSLEFRHIISHLLCVCSEGKNEDLLHEVILIVGYFTVLNNDNQVFVQTGRPPTLLQHLCSLPFQYFSDPRLRNVLFPTLIAACFENEENKKIIEQEVSCALLENYIEEQILDLHHDHLLPSQSGRRSDGEVSQRFALVNRFPSSRWEDARCFLLGS
ncbi:S phase cyclin A-associated protein in the endoplasmic reticulum-like isoform X2 [Oculina patagonica]